jgi:hypothetical protein
MKTSVLDEKPSVSEETAKYESQYVFTTKKYSNEIASIYHELFE